MLIYISMATVKTASKGASKGTFICASCETEFSGTSCPECGNKSGNRKLASDGIEHTLHNPNMLFGSVDDMHKYNSKEPDDFLMSVQSNNMAAEEFKDNMRQSKVMSSEIKKLDSEKKLIQKRHEVERMRDGWEDTYAPPEQNHNNAEQVPQQPLFGAQSPQSQFMSQLMRMEGEKRAEFMQQLNDADPAALQTLSNMFVTPVQNAAPVQPGMPGMYQQGMYPPYGMPQQQVQQTEPKESSTSMMREMFALMKEMQPEKDDSAIEVIRDLKDEIKSLHNRIDSVTSGAGNGGNSSDALVQYVKNLDAKVEMVQQRPSFSEQAKELKDTIKNLESIGLVNNNSGDMSVEDKIRMKELDHQIDMETKRYGVDQEVADTNLLKQRMREDFAKQIFTQGFGPKVDVHEPEPALIQQSAPKNPFLSNSAPKVLNKPKVIVDTIESDTGVVNQIQSSTVQSEEPE